MIVQWGAELPPKSLVFCCWERHHCDWGLSAGSHLWGSTGGRNDSHKLDRLMDMMMLTPWSNKSQEVTNGRSPSHDQGSWEVPQIISKSFRLETQMSGLEKCWTGSHGFSDLSHGDVWKLISLPFVFICFCVCPSHHFLTDHLVPLWVCCSSLFLMLEVLRTLPWLTVSFMNQSCTVFYMRWFSLIHLRPQITGCKLRGF